MSDFGNFSNVTGQNIVQSGPTAKKIDGDSFSTQTGNATSVQYGNKNAYQRGLTDSLFAGLTFTTNAAGTFSTTLGTTVSTFIGGKITVNGAIEAMVNLQAKYSWGAAVELRKETETATVSKRKTHFAEDYKDYINQKQETAVSVDQNVLTANLTYGEVTTTVAGDDTKTVEGSHQVLAKSHSFVSPDGGILKIGGNIVMNGKTLNFSGTTINLE